MLGDNITRVGWPKCGEIDIAEMIGGGENRDDSIYGTLHWDANNAHAYHGSSAKELPDPQIFHDDYHVFEIEWSAAEIVWRLDGTEFFRTSVDTALWPTMDEFHRNFFIVLNLAVGGNWPGYPDASTVFPQQMRVDWVRVYQANPAAPPTVSLPPASTRVTVGANAEFAVTASGAGSLTYQWRRNGANVSGATSPTLTLANVQPANAGVYTVAVTNAHGTTVSAGAILGIDSVAKIAGSGNQVLFDVTHLNGNVYDRCSLRGPPSRSPPTPARSRASPTSTSPTTSCRSSFPAPARSRSRSTTPPARPRP
jgi:beta-glucanase (GH16 family)